MKGLTLSTGLSWESIVNMYNFVLKFKDESGREHERPIPSDDISEEETEALIRKVREFVKNHPELIGKGKGKPNGKGKGGKIEMKHRDGNGDEGTPSEEIQYL